ncbi:acyl-CoA synthetase [Polyangium aurulentum]|uniref:SLOG cluster 4 domain-containing protein n=1 Tax=Polyangium aurulentum TaxID=2567896 RepID=UPI0010AEAF69|nr:acyl-CoA synthetase [Polyangium aurulentum]UQA56562.1 TIGR00725 family protein [Polyangium aurulentum]
MPRPLLAIIGDGNAVSGSPAWEAAFAAGRAAVDHGFRVLTGGGGGVMEAACRGAYDSARYRDGDTVGLLPGHDPALANAFVDIVIPTGLGHLRNALVAHADAIVAVGGGAGTLSEMAMGWIHDRVVVALEIPGWSGELADRRLDARQRFSGVPDDRVIGAKTGEEAIALVLERWGKGSR